MHDGRKLANNSGSSLDMYICIHVRDKGIIQGVFNYLSLIFCAVLLYNLLISCVLNDPIITLNFDETLI
jgi:hypothetical protein